jgi:hypothetical protein
MTGSRAKATDMSIDTERESSVVAIATVVIGVLVVLLMLALTRQGTLLAEHERRLSLVESNAYQTLTAAQSVQADLGALRNAILAAMGHTNYVGRGLTFTGTNITNWQTKGVPTNNAYARPLPPGTPRVVQP